MSPADAPTWERLLWKKQPFPDNYVPPSFLNKLQTNATIILPSYATLVVWSLPITQQIASILAFVGAFAHLLNGKVSAIELALGSSLTMLLGWAIFEVFIPEQNHRHPAARAGGAGGRKKGPGRSEKSTRERIRQAANTIVSLFLLSLVLLALSPVLRTLTEATTSDSIWALSVGMFAVSAALADYSSAGRSIWIARTVSDEGTADRSSPVASMPSREDHGLTEGASTGGLTSALSLNAAICASVVLGSRLPSDLDVFALMLLAVHFFALLPLASVRLRACELEIVPVRADVHPIKGEVMHASPTLQDRTLAQDSSEPLSRASVPMLRTRHPFLVPQIILTTLLVILSSGTLALLNTSAALLSVMAYAFISAGCPAWMRWAQLWKRELKGPWDPAVPRVWGTAQSQSQ
ncbi:unnamed protein product [Tilletia controversa]|uniref:Uncharacterized protein n=1 Tax=Tilletia controversa TaxID=13291 RepID=A0A8X7MZ05_9BASI|nr:hypothetical protein CF328_g2777 [Tilletia controversa]KAE8255238.1 hypothetical protein A4X06_0g534 [Tilletia controversa]CAD6910510.1 unnamed protein product [Tilletia controversa]CAD6940765.1 unnamed protein product [Tilletia controversa]CAD6949993.1 unnamed protein product [Tilletia controversa]